MSRKVKLIFNPIANLGRAWSIASALRPIVYELGGADWTGTVFPTHASELAIQAAKDGYELVVAMGGDGTVHEVVNGLMQVPPERRPRLGVVPIGSGNDFAHAAGISSQPEIALRQALTGQPHPIDIGLVRDSSGRTEYWANTVGIGFDTIVTIRSRKVPIVQGFAVYFAAVLQTILFNYQPYYLQVRCDGAAWEDELLMMVLCNGTREGGGFRVVPTARINDGILNFVSVRRISRPQMLHTLTHFLHGTQSSLPHVRMGEFRHIELTSDRPMHIHTDGEIFAGLSSSTQYLSVEILPNMLEIVC